MEETSKDSERRLADILQFLPDATFVVDTDGTVTAWNRAMEALTGIPARDMIGRGNFEYAVPFYGERRPVLIDLVRAPDEAALKRYSGVRREGDTLFAEGFAPYMKTGGWFEAAAAPLRDAEGHLVGAIETYRDITERKRIESQLKESQRRLADIIEFLPDATFAIDAEGKLTAWNRAAEVMTGVKAKDLLGQGNYEHAVPFYGKRRPVLIDLVMRPLDEVMAQYAHLQRHGDTLTGQGHITNIGGGDLFFVGSAAALRDSDGHIVGAIETVRDVTERKRFEDELARAKDAAEAANRAKSAFLATMSHEIRTPMNAILGMSGLLLDSPLTPQQNEFALAIRNSGEVLLTVINDILDFSKIEAERLELETRPLDVRQCVASALDVLAYRARDKKLELGCRIEAHTPSVVLGDPTRLNQILINLVGNAIKFTEKGEVMIHVASRCVEEAAVGREGTYEIHFAISDTGVGIPADRMDRLFQAFSQGDSSTSRRYGGTGLGLAISKRLAEMMNGRIWAESELGKGSTFHFTITARATTAPADDHAPTEERFMLDPEMGRTHPLRILLAEDNPTNQLVAAAMLDRLGYRADVASDGRETVEAVNRQPYDVVLMDVQMPGMDGLEATREIRRCLPEPRQPRIIAMTADAMAEDREACLAAGMDDYISKPVLIEKLVAALQKSVPAGTLRTGPVLPVAPGPAPSGQAAGAAPVVDPAALKRLRETLGRQADAMLPALLKSFASDGVRLLQAARAALDTKNASDLRRAAHTLKSTSATFGAMALSATAREIEDLAKNNMFDGVTTLIERAGKEFAEARNSLKE